MPSNGRVAIIVRGQAFRSGGRYTDGCDEHSVWEQRRAIQAVLGNIVLPLERQSNVVDAYLSDGANCTALLPRIAGLFGKRLVAAEGFESTDQAHGMKHALEMFSSRAGDPTVYKLIFVLRFDTVWKLPIDEWPTADFGAFNFFARCGKPSTWCNGTTCSWPPVCVQDILQVMPGAYWRRFSKELVGTDHCFEVNYRHGSGHECYNRTVAAFGADHVTFVTDWIPEKNVREVNSVVELGYD